MTFHRPHSPKSDKNHAQILREFSQMVGGWTPLVDSEGTKHKAWSFMLCGVPGVIVDTASQGGLSLDLRYYGRDGVTIDFEVKTAEAYRSKGHGMTAGERLYFETIGGAHGCLITSAEELYKAIADGIR
jgi:hypothetical protein